MYPFFGQIEVVSCVAYLPPKQNNVCHYGTFIYWLKEDQKLGLTQINDYKSEYQHLNLLMLGAKLNTSQGNSDCPMIKSCS